MFSIRSASRLAAALALGVAILAPTAAKAGGIGQPPLPKPLQPSPWIPPVPDLVLEETPRVIGEALHSGVVRLRVTVRNRGTGRTTAPFSVSALISVIAPDADLPSSVFPITTLRVTRSLAPGESVMLDFSPFTWATGTPRGTILLAEYFADSRREIRETNETNNALSLRYRAP